MPKLDDEDLKNAKALGSYIDGIMDSNGSEALNTEQLDSLRWHIENEGIDQILQYHFLFTEEDIDLFISSISEKSSATGDDWKSISRILYYEYMCRIQKPENSNIGDLEIS